jgi:hypothetical protein
MWGGVIAMYTHAAEHQIDPESARAALCPRR